MVSRARLAAATLYTKRWVEIFSEKKNVILSRVQLHRHVHLLAYTYNEYVCAEVLITSAMDFL